jgi:hypothetical protein
MLLFLVDTQLGFSGHLANFPIVNGTPPVHEDKIILILTKNIISYDCYIIDLFLIVIKVFIVNRSYYHY